tara:strand:- start:44 stop:865 length:822 start_codon:yes stop_codon:yes gene_type:complete
MTDKLGLWEDIKGLSLPIEEYKHDNYVTSLPLWTGCRGNESVGFSFNQITRTFFLKELKAFLLDNPIYYDVLTPELDGYGDFDTYFATSLKLNEISNVFANDNIGNTRTTWNNLRMLWYLKNIHENIKPIWEFDNIIDFGAGTGHFIKHCYQVGFKGSVQIIDIPVTIPIQEYVLRGVDVKWVDIEEVLTHLPNTLFNSTWGFSETPLSLRDKLPDITTCSKFIAFQHNFYGVDNKKDIMDRFYEKDSSILRDISVIAPWDEGSTFLMSKSFI